MIPGLFVAEHGPGFRLALCLGGPDPASAWFIAEDGSLLLRDWDSFHRDCAIVGLFADLAGYPFTSPMRARDDWLSGLFTAGFAAATRAQWDLTPD